MTNEQIKDMLRQTVPPELLAEAENAMGKVRLAAMAVRRMKPLVDSGEMPEQELTPELLQASTALMLMTNPATMNIVSGGDIRAAFVTMGKAADVVLATASRVLGAGWDKTADDEDLKLTIPQVVQIPAGSFIMPPPEMLQ